MGRWVDTYVTAGRDVRKFRQWQPDHFDEPTPPPDGGVCPVCGMRAVGDPQGSARLKLNHDMAIHDEWNAKYRDPRSRHAADARERMRPPHELGRPGT